MWKSIDINDYLTFLCVITVGGCGLPVLQCWHRLRFHNSSEQNFLIKMYKYKINVKILFLVSDWKRVHRKHSSREGVQIGKDMQLSVVVVLLLNTTRALKPHAELLFHLNSLKWAGWRKRKACGASWHSCLQACKNIKFLSQLNPPFAPASFSSKNADWSGQPLISWERWRSKADRQHLGLGSAASKPGETHWKDILNDHYIPQPTLPLICNFCRSLHYIILLLEFIILGRHVHLVAPGQISESISEPEEQVRPHKPAERQQRSVWTL